MTSRLVLRLSCAGAALLLAVSALVATTSSGVSSAVNADHDGQYVNPAPAADTPRVLDGRVYAITQVGSRMIAGGSFGQVANASGPTVARTSIFAFDAATGALDTSFVPTLNGDVNALLPGPTPGTVYVGGSFGQVNGANAKGLVLLDVATGQRVTSFRTNAMNGTVNDLARNGSRIFVGGTFTSFGGTPRGGLASVNATTGVVDGVLTQTVTEHHNYDGTGAQAAVGVRSLDVTPDGSALVAIGNFQKVDGLERDQAVLLDLSSGTAQVADWRTRRFEPACARNAFDSYVREVDISPDGTFFVIVSTGAPFPGTLCDTAARFETASRGQDIQPTWIDDTGGDTLWSVAIAGDVVYIGGHQRWANNVGGRDRAVAGAVPRPGLAALWAHNGMPLSWNPGRNPRGAGAFALYATPTGLWMGSDTEWIGDFEYRRPRVAYFPLAGGGASSADDTSAIPASIMLAGRIGFNDLRSRYYDGTTVGAEQVVPGGGVDWSSVRGAMLVGDWLYYGRSNSNLYRRTYDGTTFGPEQTVDPYNDPLWSSVDTGSGQTYRGVKPSFYSELPSVTSMAYWQGRLYYTLSLSSALYYRDFSPESGIIHPTRNTVPGVTMPLVNGMFVSGDSLYFAPITGGLQRRAFVNGVPTGSTTTVSTADWRARGLFLTGNRPPPPNETPTAALSVDCAFLECDVDGSASSDPDGTVASYAWEFGDGATATGETATHMYSEAGTYTVSLTVTDDDGATDTTTREVTVAEAGGDPVVFRDAATATATSASASVPLPDGTAAEDALLMFVTTNKAASIGVTVPAGWTLADTRESSTMTTRVYWKIATPSEPASIPVSVAELSKVDLTVLAYAGTSTTAPIAQLVSTAAASGTQRTTPSVVTTPATGYVVSYWADKSSVTTDWTAPSGQVQRAESIGSGTGYVTSLTTDGGAQVGPGTSVGGVTATSDATGSRATMVTVVLAG